MGRGKGATGGGRKISAGGGKKLPKSRKLKARIKVNKRAKARAASLKTEYGTRGNAPHVGRPSDADIRNENRRREVQKRVFGKSTNFTKGFKK